jgi:tetratricopeptide (TPR) repeat protein
MHKRCLMLALVTSGLLFACQNDDNNTQNDSQNPDAKVSASTQSSASAPAKTDVSASAKTDPSASAKSPAADPSVAAAPGNATHGTTPKDPDYKAGIEALQLNHPADAVKAFDAFLSKHPKDVNGLNNRGVSYMRMGKGDLALKDFNLAAESSPDVAVSYYNRATLTRLQSSSPTAMQSFMEDLSKAISHDPTFVPALYDRANLYLFQKRYDKAIQDIDQVLKYVPDNADTYNFRGFVSLQQGKQDEALKDFDHALQLNPKFGMAMANKAQTLNKMGKCQESLEWLKKSCQSGYQKGCQLLKQVTCK